jgi:mannosylglycoprotein endo-beta-mannosidase
MVDNRRVTEHGDKAEAVDSFFEELLGTSADRPFSLDLDFLGIPSTDLRQIDGEFTPEEVWDAIKGMPLDKYPWPDGFSARFFVVCWDIIKVDIMAAFNSLSRLDSRGFGAVNSTLITLLPKKPGAEEVRDFRPISLIHGIAKWVAKVISNRLAPLLPQMVGAHQSAFVRGRCLHDNFMMVQGTARKVHSLKQPAILLKLDISKAFDMVDWSFLLEVLKKMGFGARLLACICALLSTASTRVLLNGTPGARVANRRGLRQGDTLSPQLFILVMEVLHFALEKATQQGNLALLATSGLRQRTSIYADDVVAFLRPNVGDLRCFAAIIDDFGAASGLRTNLSKCSAHLIRCPVETSTLVDLELGCPMLPFPLRYLGLPLGLRRPTAAQLQYLVDAVANRLPGWRASMLNRAGHLELVRSTLAVIPIFALMSLDIQIENLLAIEKILRGFLWKGRRDAHGGHCLVAWDRVCMPKELGGLGIINLRKMNLALRVRWLWLSRVEASRPWKEFEIQVPPM